MWKLFNSEEVKCKFLFKLQHEISKLDNTEKDPIAALTSFLQAFMRALDQFAPFRTYTPRKRTIVPWMNNFLKNMINKKYKYYKIWAADRKIPRKKPPTNVYEIPLATKLDALKSVLYREH